jgi:ubiquinone/menaquinone biosynthesis C-methylase UbiE
MAKDSRPTDGSTTHTEAGAASAANEVYSLGRSQGESERLLRQSDELAPHSSALLDRVELRPGDSAIDVGCGPRGIIELLCARVGPAGRVVGVDADPHHVAMARDLASERQLPGVEIVEADARQTGLPANTFDLVHARTLLITIPEPADVLAEMVRVAKPGGWVAGLEPDTEFSLCYPSHPAVERLREIFPVVFGRNGADPWIGRKVAGLYQQAGLEDVGAEAVAPLYPATHTRRTIRLDLIRSMRPQILELGLADEHELDELDRAARAHLADPATVVVPNIMFLTWGRKRSVR